MALKNRKKIGTSLKNEVNEKLKKLHEETHIPKSKLFDEAIEDLYKKYKDKFNLDI
jgi:predicted DNA-binding protein